MKKYSDEEVEVALEKVLDKFDINAGLFMFEAPDKDSVCVLADGENDKIARCIYTVMENNHKIGSLLIMTVLRFMAEHKMAELAVKDKKKDNEWFNNEDNIAEA
jgi:hypothetical protein